MVPNTIMPDMNFQTKDAVALSMLVMSWRGLTEIPKDFLPGFEMKEERTAAEIEKRKENMMDRGTARFLPSTVALCVIA